MCQKTFVAYFFLWHGVQTVVGKGCTTIRPTYTRVTDRRMDEQSCRGNHVRCVAVWRRAVKKIPAPRRLIECRAKQDVDAGQSAAGNTATRNDITAAAVQHCICQLLNIDSTPSSVIYTHSYTPQLPINRVFFYLDISIVGAVYRPGGGTTKLPPPLWQTIVGRFFAKVQSHAEGVFVGVAICLSHGLRFPTNSSEMPP